MKVTDLQAYLLSAPLVEPVRTPLAIGEWICHKFDYLVVRIHTDQGISGHAAGTPSANLAQLINRNLKSAVVNVDPVKIESLRKKILRRPQFPGLAQAFGLVEAALIDLQGKIEGRSASELLGNSQTAVVPLLPRSLLFLDSSQCVEEALSMSEQGFGSYRFRLGLGWERDTETLHRLRQVLPGGCRLVADAQAWWQLGNTAYAEAEYEAWLRHLAQHAPLWLAEPFRAGDLQARHRIVTAKAVPIASGEYERDSESLQALGESGVDILQVNVMQLGGLVSSKPLLHSLAAQGKQFVLTGATTPLEVVALAHLATGFSEKSCLGVDWPCFATAGKTSLFAAELLKQPLPIENGCLTAPGGLGFGVEVNEAVLHRFPWKSGAASGVA